MGQAPQMQDFLTVVESVAELKAQVKGWVDGGEMALARGVKSRPFVWEELDLFLTESAPQAIVIGPNDDGRYPMQKLFAKCAEHSVDVFVLPDFSHVALGQKLHSVLGLSYWEINAPSLSILDLYLKRSFDFLLTLIGGLLISPLLLLLAIIVKATSKGPIFYGQERVGLDGKNFKMWKFRTMKVGAEAQTGAVWAIENDPRRTPLGTFLRKSSLDELPQIWNVLRGEMSLVGPRPERPVFVEKFKREIPSYMLRLKAKAGITGWAQINGWRGNTSLEKRIECDLLYIKNWSLWFDIKILVMTFWKGLFNKNAY